VVSYILDTEVISELRKHPPRQSVIQFLQALDDDQPFLSVITIGEIAEGIGRMPSGARRTMVANWFLHIRMSFADRVLRVDEETAELWGQLSATVHRAGGRLDVADGLIAAAALAHGLTVVTRNTKDSRKPGCP